MHTYKLKMKMPYYYTSFCLEERWEMILIRVGTVEQKEEVLARSPQSVGIDIFHFLEFLEFTIKMLHNTYHI